MGGLGCAHYRWSSEDVVPSLPFDPSPPAPVEGLPGRSADRWMARVAEFPSGADRGVLWEGRVESVTERLRELGPNQAVVSAPTTPAVMRTLGDPIPGTDAFHLRNTIARELLLGRTDTGRTRYRVFPRDEVSVRGGRVEIPCVGIVGGLTSERVIGAPTRLDFLGSLGRFGPVLRGWRHVGPGTSGTREGGVDGSGWYAWIKGIPGQSYLEARVRWSLDDQPWGRQWFGAQVYPWLPSGQDLDGYGLISLAVVDPVTGKVWWSYDQNGGDPEMGLVDPSMPTGRWVSEGPVTCKGLLPRPPYTVDLCVRLHATHPTEETRFDDARGVRPENTSTVVDTDLTRHLGKLMDHAQRGRAKSTWGVSVVYGEAAGISERGMWPHDAAQELDDAIEALCGRGLEVWDLPGPGRAVKAAKRRGAIRSGVVLNPWDIVGEVVWRTDVGAQKTAARGVSAATSLWGGSDEGAIDTRWSRKQIIDVNLSGPVGMLPGQLVEWLNGQLSSLALTPSTTTVLVPEEWVDRSGVVVGDTFRVRARDGAAGLVDWMRLSQLAIAPPRGLCALDLGTDPTRGGRG